MEKECETYDLAKNILIELRKETLESQKIRNQLVASKITIITAIVGIVLGALDKLPYQLIVIPAFASMFFDFLIVGINISIKRVGYYIRKHIEPNLKKHANWPDKDPLWEEFMDRRGSNHVLSIIGNFGLTFITVLVAIIILISKCNIYSISLIFSIVILFIIDIWAFSLPGRFFQNGSIRTPNNIDTEGLQINE